MDTLENDDDEFEQLEDYPKYELNKKGIVRTIKEKYVMKIYKKLPRSYLSVSILDIDNNKKKLPIHYLLGIIYLDNPNNYKYIIHKNYNIDDYRLENLEWNKNIGVGYNPATCPNPDIWIQMKDFPKYMISRHGIKNIDSNKILEGCTNGNYIKLNIKDKNNKKTSILLHKVIGEHFLPKIDGYEIVNHIDSNKSNYKIENLEVVHPAANGFHSMIERGGIRKENLYKTIEEFDDNGNIIKTYTTGKELDERINVSRNTFWFRLRHSENNVIKLDNFYFRCKKEEDLPGEIWKFVRLGVKDIDETFMVSNKARIRNIKTGVILKTSIKKDSDRISVTLQYNNIKITKHIHVIMGYTFFDNFTENLQINHKDKNPMNNDLENLEVLNAKDHGEKDHAMPVFYISDDKKDIIIFKTKFEAAKYFDAKVENILGKIYNENNKNFTFFDCLIRDIDDLDIKNIIKFDDVEEFKIFLANINQKRDKRLEFEASNKLKK